MHHCSNRPKDDGQWTMAERHPSVLHHTVRRCSHAHMLPFRDTESNGAAQMHLSKPAAASLLQDSNFTSYQENRTIF